MADYDILLKLLMAFGIGLLIGIERGWKMRELAEGQRVAGVRTFSLIGLLGGLSAYLSNLVGPWILLVSTAGVFLFILFAYLVASQKVKYKGATTEVAAILTFFLGVLAVLGDPSVVITLTVLLLVVLGLKAPFHRALEKLNKIEITAFFQMVVLSVLVLPLLPNRGFGPGEVLNPFEIWLMVVLIQGISFFGHFAIRLWGQKAGTLLMGFLGGLASTTALTVTAASLARKKGADHLMLAASISAGNAVMFLRTLIIISVVNFALVPVMAAPLVLGSLGAVLGAFYLHKKAKKAEFETATERKAFLPSPTNLVSAFSFAALLAVIMVLTYYAKTFLATEGVAALAAFSGLLDVDAITISLSKMAGTEGVSDISNILVLGVFIALVSNSFAKTGISFFMGNARFGKTVITVFAFALGGVGLGLAASLL